MGIKLSWRKHSFGALLLALAMILTLLPTSISAADTRSASENAIVNGSFETPAFGGPVVTVGAGSVTPWRTTATDNSIELGKANGSHPHLNSKDLSVPDGTQFAELNARQESTLYQDATTIGGNVYEWGLSHRGRNGIDRMALIIGPEQKAAPTKPNANGRDQFMQMTDWVRNHAAEMQVTIPDTGCTQKITVYSKPFDKKVKGGFENNADNNPFSATPSDVYSEEWNVWIISTDKEHWGDYGTNSQAYEDGTLAYSCRYTVPVGQTKTIFAFSSYSSAYTGSTPDPTIGNLLDNIHFSLYQTITIGANGGGKGSLTVSADDKDETYEVSSGKGAEALAPNGGTVTVRAEETSDTQFLGAYVTRQTPSGMVREFFPVDQWKEQPDGSYTYEHKVVEPADIVLVFVKKTVAPEIKYDANGGDAYTHGDGGSSTVSFSDKTTYTAQAAAEKDGWQFTGWLLARSDDLLPADHTVTYDGSGKLTFKNADGTVITSIDGGATLIAQWQWRQRFVVQVKNGGDFTNDTACGTVTVSGGATSDATTDCYAGASERVSATAAASSGYHFLGWYDGEGQFLDNSAAYSYSVDRGSVRTVYARFAKVHTVTYEWTKEADKCPPNAPTPPSPGTVIDGRTYVIDQTYTKGYAIDGTVTENGRTVPGKWVFTGWRSGESGDSDIRETELINVTGNRTLTGFWTFEPEAAHTLTYQFADNTRWSPSGSFEQTENYYRGESVKTQSEPARNQTPDGKDVLVTGDVTLYGDWTFKGWKRSDKENNAKEAMISTGEVFSMPGNNLTLTGQWEFIPYTYTVVYDLGNGTIEADPNNENYDYSKLLGSSKPGCNAPSTGIPFGASIELMELPDGTAVPEGKYFAGWSRTNPKDKTEEQINALPTQDPGDSVGYRKLGVTENGQKVTLYAVYKNKDVATVDFAVNDSNWGDVGTKSGSFTVRGSTVDDEQTVSSTATPRSGYHFAGWYEKNDKGELTPAKDEKGNKITGAELVVTAVMMQKKLASLTADEDATEAPVLVVHYVAVFARDSFTVKFDGNGMDVTGKMEPQTFNGTELEDQSTTLRKNAFVRPGYEFIGWAEYPSGNQGRTYSDEAPFAEVKNYREKPIENGGEITLYAQWKEIDPVTIIYTAAPASLGTVRLNDGEAAAENDIAVQDGSIYEKLNPVTGKARGAVAEPGEGSVFVGWFDYNDTERKTPLTTAGALTYIPGPDFKTGLYKNSSYVAVFRQKQYVLHYDANGGTGTMEDQIFPHGQAHSLRECTFLREGYDFVGWAKDASAAKIDYVSQQGINLNAEFPALVDDGAEVTLYAVWRERDVTLNYASSDESLGAVSRASESVKAATGVPAGSTAQAKSGARFDGWYSADGTLLSTELTFVPTKADGAVWQGTTYYARFSAQRRPSAPSAPEKPDDAKSTLAPIPAMLNGEDHYAYLLGYEDGTVRPDQSISRAEVATVLFRLLKDDVRTQNLTKDNAYSDVPNTAWYNTAVSTLSKIGVISGYPDGTFRPNAPITRAEFAAMIARFDETAKAVDTPFTDISGHWAESAIGKAYGNGWVEGSSKTAFCPESNITRAETATLLNRVLHRLPERESDLFANQIVWPDNPKTFWGYLAMQEATNSHEYERKADGVHETQTAKRENRDWSKEFEQ